jgi:4-diphosphocytidyl-2-C-methyl-D-erythritol kinase
VFQALDLAGRSTADPLSLLGLHTTGAAGADKHVNDLEPPAFAVVPELAALKAFLVTCGFKTVIFYLT